MKKVYYVDLDGTYVDVNSFHKWIIFLVTRAPISCVSLRAEVLWSCGLRLTKRIRHSELKRRIMMAYSSLADDRRQALDAQFVSLLKTHVNPNVEELRQSAGAQGARCVLATAAPAFYAEPFGRAMGFDLVMATPSPATALDDWQENIRQAKAERILRDMQENEYEGTDAVMVTDHLDDAPSMSLASVVYWVGNDVDLGVVRQNLASSCSVMTLTPSHPA